MAAEGLGSFLPRLAAIYVNLDSIGEKLVAYYSEEFKRIELEIWTEPL